MVLNGLEIFLGFLSLILPVGMLPAAEQSNESFKCTLHLPILVISAPSQIFIFSSESYKFAYSFCANE